MKLEVMLSVAPLVARTTVRSKARAIRRALMSPVGTVALWIFRLSGSKNLLRVIRRTLDIQLNERELADVYASLADRDFNAQLLVFGLGRDSPFWQLANRNGRTIFLEDNEAWFDNILYKFPNLEAYRIQYTTRKEEFDPAAAARDAVAHPLLLPKTITELLFDVILVDGPASHTNADPGRLQSIATARKLAASGADIFIHDVNRYLESHCCKEFFSDSTFCGTTGRLRHFRVPDVGGCVPASVAEAS